MSFVRRVTAQVPTVVLARRNVSRATTRSALAVVAVVIGVVAIGGIGVGGEAFKQNQLRAYEDLGGTATVTPVVYEDEPDTATFSETELQRMQQAAGSATLVPIKNPIGQAVVLDPSGDPIVFTIPQGIGDPSRFYEAKAGEIPANFDGDVAVVGSALANDNDIEVGDTIEVTSTGDDDVEGDLRVVAILPSQGQGDPLNADRAVFFPSSRLDRDEYDEVIVESNPNVAGIDTVAERIEDEFNDRRDRVSVTTSQSRKEQQEEQFTLINQFLLGISGISLLVAAVTIANTMLMSAIEREGEIGVLRAVGYSKFAVVRLLVAEATLLGVIGVVVGGTLSLVVGLIVNQVLLGEPLAFTATGLQYIGLGVVFGVLTALIGGLYPAWRAANKRPVEALG